MHKSVLTAPSRCAQGRFYAALWLPARRALAIAPRINAGKLRFRSQLPLDRKIRPKFSLHL